MQIKSRLGGGKSGDPSLYIDIVDRRRGLLFDCGLNNFRHAQLRRVSDVFISHTHIDHFIGFDTLLRLNLAESKTLCIYGPPGILHNVSGKLQGYTWNICQNLKLVIIVKEILPDRIVTAHLHSHEAFAVHQTNEEPHSHLLLDTGEFTVSYLELDHKTPSFAYSFVETDTFNVQKEIMSSLGLPPGPWVAKLKQQAANPDAREQDLSINSRHYSFGYLIDTLLVRKKGRKITYLTDCVFEASALDAIAEFAREADLLYCESAFLERDREKARCTYHLTAREAGEIARRAQAKKLIVFHFSKRYQDLSRFFDEAKTEFPAVE